MHKVLLLEVDNNVGFSCTLWRLGIISVFQGDLRSFAIKIVINMQEKLLDAIHGCAEPCRSLERSNMAWLLHEVGCSMNAE